MKWLHRLRAQVMKAQTLQTRFDLVNEASNEGLWDMSVIAGDPINPYNEFWWSNQFRKMLGYNDEKDFPNVLDSWASRLHPDDKEWVLKAFAAHLTDTTGRVPYDVEYRLLTKEEDYRWYRARGCTRRNGQGIPLRVAGSLADITEAKQQMLTLQALVRGVKDNTNVVTETSTQISTASGQLGQTAANLASTVKDIAHAATQTAATSQEMAKGSEEQAQAASQAANAMEQLDASISRVRQGSVTQQQAVSRADAGMQQATQAVGEVSSSTQQMAVIAQEAATIAQTGGRAVEQAIASMDLIQTQVRTSAQSVQELGQKSQQVGAFVQTIDEIAEQTNLLALNAAIEAARAGEHGKGFAVVADEVRKLAERANGATKEISILIREMCAGVEQAISAMDASKQEVTEGAKRGAEAGQMLTRILQSVQSVASQVDRVASISQKMTVSVEAVQSSVLLVSQTTQENMQAVQEMVAGAQQVNASISTVAAASQEMAAGAQEMSASAEDVAFSAQSGAAAVEQQTVSIREMSASAKNLNQMAANLQELVTQFKVDAGDTAKSEERTTSSKTSTKPKFVEGEPLRRAA